MSPAEALVADLHAKGVELIPEGDRLRARPAAALTPEDVAALRRHKPALLALLTGSPGPALEPARGRSVALDPRTVAEVLGPSPDPHAVACLRFDVLAAIQALEGEVQAGRIAPGLRLVAGRPLADWLDLGDLAALLRAWRHEARR